MITIGSLLAHLEKSLFVIGDLLIDRTHYVDVSKLSPEAPVPVAMLTGAPVDTPGGAGLAAVYAAVNNLPIVFGTFTSQSMANAISTKYKIPIVSPLVSGHSFNAIKTRYIDNERHYHLLRVDNDNLVAQPFVSCPETEEQWFSNIKETLQTHEIKVLLLLDYRKGLLVKDRAQRLIAIAKAHNIPIYVDSRSRNLQNFKNASILKLNAEEFSIACDTFGFETKDSAAAITIVNELNLEYLIVTLGADGAILYDKTALVDNFETTKSSGSPDVTGCGDVFDVTFCYHWGIKEIDIIEAMAIAVNKATDFAYAPIGERLKCQK